MLTYKLYRDPYDNDEILFPGRLERKIEPGFSVLVGCNGSGKTTVINSIRDKYLKDEDFKVFRWDGLTDKRYEKDMAIDSQNYELLSALAFSSEGEEISLNIGVLAGRIGNFVRRNRDKNIIILLDGLDSGLSIDNIVEVKSFFKELLIPDIEKDGCECYVIVSANEYELAKDEVCIDARTGNIRQFKDYEDYRKFILNSRKIKGKRHRD